MSLPRMGASESIVTPKKAIPAQAATKTDAKCRVNRTHDLFVLWKEQNPGVLVPEADTLKGRIGGDVLFTIDFPCQLMMAFHKERETAQVIFRTIIRGILDVEESVRENYGSGYLRVTTKTK